MPLVHPWYGLGLLLAAAAACAPKEPPPPAAPAVDSAAVRAAVASLWQRWIVADTAGNAAALADLVADSIRIDNKGGPPIIGKAAWRTFAETMYKGVDVLGEEITPDLTVAITNELAYQSGNYLETTLSGKKKTADYGRFAAALEKGADGKWRIRYIMAFSDSSVAAK